MKNLALILDGKKHKFQKYIINLFLSINHNILVDIDLCSFYSAMKHFQTLDAKGGTAEDNLTELSTIHQNTIT